MTNKEAYNIISEMLETNLLTPQESEALKTANKALEALLPKKPKVVDSENLITYICPTCHRIVEHRDKLSGKNFYYTRGADRCYCGQEMDWSDECDSNN